MTANSAFNITADPLGRWRFGVDRGGTFTDVVAIDPAGQIHTAKLLSQSILYEDAAIEGIRSFLGSPTGEPLPQKQVAWIRLGTTVATNALLERKGAKVGLLISKGFRDLLQIGSGRRPELFSLAVRTPKPLYQRVEEADERILADGSILHPLDPESTTQALQRLQDSGIDSLAILFMHAWKNPRHELQGAEIGRKMGFDHISVSHKTLSMIQMVGRGRTTLIDAYLTPILLEYIDRVRCWTGDIPLHFMSSAGGLLAGTSFSGKDAILSGPAGGVTGVGAIAEESGDQEVIGFDMGGTSSDVCRYDGQFEKVLEAETAGIRYYAPMLNMETVAAGGGSILHFDGQKLSVGPDSAGSDPGPACYGLGGPATITDANLIVGRIVPECFPKLFGAKRNASLSLRAAKERMQQLVAEVKAQTKQQYSLESLALGYIRIANETMGRAIKNLSVAKGFDLRRHALISFGGAGGQHCCGIAASLNIKNIRLPPLAGVLSAYGIAMAAHGRTHVQTVLAPLNAQTLNKIFSDCNTIATTLQKQLAIESGLRGKGLFKHHFSLDLRLPGTDSPLNIAFDPDLERIEKSFADKHQKQYGFTPPAATLELLNIRVEVVERQLKARRPTDLQQAENPTPTKPTPRRMETVWFEEQHSTPTPLYNREELAPGNSIEGPALISQPHSITVVEPGFTATMDPQGMLNLKMEQEKRETVAQQRDPILLALFNHRFAGIATRMGETLARTAHSINIKERLDFSCALFDGEGRLVANAPHVPVHLGAMGATVQSLLQSKLQTMQPGDVYVSNDPAQGGSHLPDITVITPMFRNLKLQFFLASRGHHADIGGTVPGSMPPFATTLQEEGILLSNQLLVRDGLFRQKEISSALNTPPYPARNLPERLSDLRAMVAAGERGIQELGALCDLYGDKVVTSYMGYVRDNARYAMEVALKKFLQDEKQWSATFTDYLDGGEKITVNIKISLDAKETPRAHIDFSGSSQPHSGNLNAPKAITRACVLYVLRTMIKADIPLNDGCMEPITITIPQNSLLDPPVNCAVAGGNVETSQRIVDVLYGALGIAAASQGTMNNLLFGNPDGSGGQYYETIAGGSGAIFGNDGASGVQVHMTNTRITDPEVLEYRFKQVRLEKFALRTGSGGAGRWRGGDGVIRKLLFTAPTMVTILSQRRSRAPYGCQGGKPGALGINLLWKAHSNIPEILPGSCQQQIEAGDCLEINTPGGGGFGARKNT